MKELQKLVILDRDGVINYESKSYIKTPDEWIPIPGSLEAIAKLSQNGYQVVVATNQSGVSRGYFDILALNAIHKKMFDAVSDVNGWIEAVFFCPHTDDDQCDCRKPKPGLFKEICERFAVPSDQIMAVGDSRRDIEAAVRAGCQPCLVLTGNGRKTVAEPGLPDNLRVFDNLLAFSEFMKHDVSL